MDTGKKDSTFSIAENLPKWKAEALNDFISAWCKHKKSCAKVRGARQLKFGESAITQVSALACNCGLWKDAQTLRIKLGCL